MKLVLFAAACLVVFATAASAETLAVDLTPDPRNPTSPQMGDNLAFHTVIRNTVMRMRSPPLRTLPSRT